MALHLVTIKTLGRREQTELCPGFLGNPCSDSTSEYHTGLRTDAQLERMRVTGVYIVRVETLSEPIEGELATALRAALGPNNEEN